jgi:hypothetical protein
MTLTERLRTRHRATVYLADDERMNGGEPCACSGCDDARAVLAFVPGEVEAPAGARVSDSGDRSDPVRLEVRGPAFVSIVMTAAEAIALGQALVLAGMEADRAATEKTP